MSDRDLTSEELERRVEEAKVRFHESISHIEDSSVAEAGKTGAEKIRRLESLLPKALSSVWNDLTTLVSLVRDYGSGRYRDIPFGSIAAATAAIIYFVSPFDMLPDFIPLFGYTDDAAVVVACLRMIQNDLEKYREWKRDQEPDQGA